MMTLLKRLLTEKRALVLPLVLALLVNFGVYTLGVYPLGLRSAGVGDRAAAAAVALRAAKRAQRAARALVERRTQAEQELKIFYNRVLPADLQAARRMTYARLPALARSSNVRYERRSFDVEQGLTNVKEARFGRLHIRMVLQGEYENLRQFIYKLETAPEFVIIDDVILSQAEANQPLTLTLELATYYRVGAHGT